MPKEKVQESLQRSPVFRSLFCKIDLSTAIKSENLTGFRKPLQTGLDPRLIRDRKKVFIDGGGRGIYMGDV
jgi:hypothetical protein